MKKHKQTSVVTAKRHLYGAQTTDVNTASSGKRLRNNVNKKVDTCDSDKSSTCMCGYGDHVPWWLPWCVVMVTMTSRIWYVTSDGSLWILHPDEIYQSVEVAFSEMYGYGFRPYEYLPLPVNVTSSSSRQVLESGMYGLRSFLFPDVFSTVLYIARVMDIDNDPFMISRTFNVIITSLLPLSVHCFTLKVFHCRLLAFLACVFTALQLHLAVFGTRTLVNSFTSPFVFLGLALCLPDDKKSDLIKYAKTVERHVKNSFENKDGINIDKGKMLSESENSSGYSSTSSSDRSPADTKVRHRFKVYSEYGHSRNDSNNNQQTEVNTSDKEVNINNNKWMFSSWRLVNACLKVYRRNIIQKSIGGFILGLICYIRIDTVLICSILYCTLLLADTNSVWSKILSTTSVVLGGTVALAIGIIFDIWRYGGTVIPPLQWFKFNVLSGNAKILFAFTNRNGYWSEFLLDPYYFSIGSFAIFCAIYAFARQKEFLSTRFKFYHYCAILVTFFLSTSVYTVEGHTELRFIHNMFVLYAIIIAASVHICISFMSNYLNSKFIASTVMAVVIILNSIHTYTNFPSIDNQNVAKWTYGNAKWSRDINTCLRMLSRKDGVTGVFVDGDLYDSAGFSILRHDISLLVKTHNEYHLYNRRKPNRFGLPNGIKVINDFSDMFHKSNDIYMSKLLMNDNSFNYIVSKRKTPFVIDKRFKYDHIDSCGRFKMYHRILDENQIREMALVSERHPVGANSTVLEYEANWLITKGLYQKAIERIKCALTLVTPRVRMYQQLFVCYFKIGRNDLVVRAESECFSKFGRKECGTPQPRVVLHEEYERFALTGK